MLAQVARGAIATVKAAFVKRSGDTMSGNLLFSPDNTYDIGASGATRPRDIYLSRDLSVGGAVYATNGNITAAAAGSFTHNGRGRFFSPADGQHRFTNNAQTQASALFSGRPTTAAAATLTDTQSGIVCLDDTSSATTNYNLPTPRAGIVFTFVQRTAAKAVRATAAAATTIRVGANVSSAGGTATTANLGDSFTLVAVSATEWLCIGTAGTAPTLA